MSEWKETDIGKLPSHWQVGQFECDLKVQGRIGWKGYKTSDLVSNGPYVVGGAEIKSSIFLNLNNAQCLSRDKFEESPEIMLKDGDVLLVTRGNLGEVGYYHEKYGEGTINPSVIILKNFKGDSKFLYYYLISKQGKANIMSLASGSSVPAIYQADVKTLLYPKPPIEEQIIIANVIYSIDLKIDLLHRQNATLEKMAETLFRQWFVEEAKEEWEIGKLGDEFDFVMGASPPGESYNEEGNGVPMYQGNADFGFRFPTNRVFTTDPKRFAEKFDTLISVRAPVGEQNMANERCCIGRGVAAFRFKKNNSFYTYTYYKMKSLMDDIKQFNETGTVFGSISKSDFENIDAIIPDLETINRFQAEVKPLDDKVITNTIQISTLTALRDTLLPKLMSGEVKIEI